MSPRVILWCGLTFAAFVFVSIVYAVHRRVRRARREMARRRFLKGLVDAYELSEEVEQRILGVG